MKIKNLFKAALIVSAAALFSVSCSDGNGSPFSEPGWKKESDWLFIYYLDADNNLNDEIYENLKQVEYALSVMRNEDGSAKEGFPSVNAVALWDGESASDAEYYENVHLHPNGALLELGADYNLGYSDYVNSYGIGSIQERNTWGVMSYLSEGFNPGENTSDLTHQVNWLSKEPDMSSYKTLKNFLSWTRRHYDSKKVVLCIADHGSGTEKEAYKNTSSRAVCTDDTNGSTRALSARNIKDALEESGYSGENKISVLWMDACLQSTVEIAYILRGYADYMVASPNVSYSHEFSVPLTNLKKTTGPLEFGKILVSEYFEFFSEDDMTYESSLQLSSGVSLLTMSLLSLDSSKLETLKQNIDSLAEELLLIKENDSACFRKIYKDFIFQDSENYENCAGLAYPGTSVYLSDIGMLCENLVSYYPEKTSLCMSARNILNLLDASVGGIIPYAWGSKKASALKKEKDIFAGGFHHDFLDLPPGERLKWSFDNQNDFYLTGGTDFISGKTIPVVKNGEYFGLTIETQNVYSEEDLLAELRSFVSWESFVDTSSMTLEQLLYEYRKILIRKYGYSFVKADAEVENMRREIEDNAGYVLNYAKYTGFSEKWGKLLSAWNVESAGNNR